MKWVMRLTAYLTWVRHNSDDVVRLALNIKLNALVIKYRVSHRAEKTPQNVCILKNCIYEHIER
jgi:hypothetical protein